MAPEQFRNAKTVGFTADLYAIGVVIFRTLTGRLPFVSRSLEAVIRMKAEQVAPKVSSMPGMPRNVLLDWFVTKTLAREPTERFQSAREMLEHWWNVMASLDEEDATDVMRGIGRVDESYAGPLRRSMRDPEIIEPPIQTFEVEDDRTLRRISPAAARPATATLVASVPVPSTAPAPAPSDPPSTDRAQHDSSPPNTIPSPNVGAKLDYDPYDYDLPTKADPNLRKLVEQELALHRTKREPPR
jgi:serine/threonine-protein kinase